jgi:hypothetical protein
VADVEPPAVLAEGGSSFGLGSMGGGKTVRASVMWSNALSLRDERVSTG